jgi:hypothetical protein
MSLTTKAMVLNLAIGIWQGYRLDRDASQKVTRDAGAEHDAARVNKHLVPKEALKDVVTASGKVRTHFYARTLPWKDNGDRLISRVMFMSFIEEHERLVGEFNAAVEEFLTTAYPAARDQAEFRMGDLFKADDYPSPGQLRSRFYINMDIDPVTEAGDFRVSLDAEHALEVRGKMERAMQERIGRAMRDVWERLSEVVGHFAKKMGSDEVFRDSTIRNIEELVELIPGLNVLDDPDLTALSAEIKAKLAGHDPKDLRKDKVTRTQAARDAEAIMAKMASFMSATTMSQPEQRQAA